MITRTAAPDTFVVDFSRAKRTRAPTLGRRLESMFVKAPVAVTVDGHAIAQAVCAVMDACDFADVQGRPWLWNDYALFLARGDHDRLRDVEELLRTDLLSLLNEEIVRRDARMPEGFVVRLLVDEADEVLEGRGVLRVRHRKDLGVLPVVPGEITMRSDRIAKPSTPVNPVTQREVGATLTHAAGVVNIPEGRVVVLGRAAPDAGADHVPLPGAGAKVSRRHVSMFVRGAQVEVTRLSGANPVEVGGSSMAEGECRTLPLPQELVLAAGAWRGTVSR